MTHPNTPFPGPAEYRGPGIPPQPPTPAPPNGPAPKRRNSLTSKPVIGVAALVAGIALGAAGTAGNAPQGATAALPAPAPTVTVTTTTTATPAAPATTEPTTAEPTSTPTPTQAPAAEDTSYKWGKKGEFTYEDVPISLKVDAPKPSTNSFDDDNLEAKLTVCNLGSDPIEELSAQGLGLYAEDNSGGQYSLYGAYRSPEFPTYSWDGAALKAGKCRTGWVSFEDGRKAIPIATDIGDQTYSWSKNGK